VAVISTTVGDANRTLFDCSVLDYIHITVIDYRLLILPDERQYESTARRRSGTMCWEPFVSDLVVSGRWRL